MKTTIVVFMHDVYNKIHNYIIDIYIYIYLYIYIYTLYLIYNYDFYSL